MPDTPQGSTATTNPTCVEWLVPPITTGGSLRSTNLTVKTGDDEMWERLNGN